MKLRVNLFTAALLPPKQILPLRLLVQSILGIAVLSALLTAGLWTLQQQQQQQIQLLSTQQQQQQAQAELMQQALLQRQPDSQLQQQLQLAQQAVQRKQALVQFLQQQQHSTTFSPVLTHLLAIDRPELWLEQFMLRPDSSSWQGLTQQPRSVAIWLQQLASQPQLQGQQFQQIEFQQQEGSSLVQFKLQSGGSQ